MNLVFDMPGANDARNILKLAPLDVPLHVECVQALPDAVAAACQGWEGCAHGRSAPLRLRIKVSAERTGTGSVEIRADSTRIMVWGPGAVGRADVEQGFADCTISTAYLDDPVALRQEVLEPLVLMLITRRDRTPFHASAFIVDGLAILLAGRTGAGKSCLAKAADTDGYQVLSDDTVFVQLAPDLTVWGWPTAAHLLAHDAPDVSSPTRLRGGTVKHIVPLRSSSQNAIACNETVLCLLSRSRTGYPSLEPISRTAAEERLWPLDEGFDLLPGPIAEAFASLAADGAWDLRLSADPGEAVRLLVDSLPRLRNTASLPPQ